MFTRILVPLDGSELAEGAIPAAQYLATVTGAALHLVRVIEPPAAVRTHGLGAPVNVYENVIEEQRQEAATYLDALQARLKSDSLSVQVAQLDGKAATTLLTYAREREIDLIVLTSHGHSGLTRRTVGSVAKGITESGSAAVLLVPLESKVPHLGITP